MKKIDLHIHTISTRSDSDFVFSLDTFKRYVETAQLDAVAVTNHNVFDAAQFATISQGLTGVAVFPGIEIDVGSGHLLVICPEEGLEQFERETAAVTQKIQQVGDHLSVSDLKAIFENLSSYLVIPHYEKKPQLTGVTLEQLRPYCVAGEVDSAKKFIRTFKDDSKLTPVLFSDSRMSDGLKSLSTRQTFVDCGELTIDALVECLRDRNKVALSATDGNDLWQVFEDGQRLSTGLNVLLGARSSGKTYVLDRINETDQSIKYIRQFALVQQDEADYERDFHNRIERKRSVLVDQHLAGFKAMLDDVMNVDLVARDKEIEKYVETLLKSAEEQDRQDAFSKAALFDEVEFPIGNTETLAELIASVRQVIENVEFRSTIEAHVDLNALRNLALVLIKQLWARSLESSKRSLVNGLVREIKQALNVRTSATQVEDVDLYGVVLDQKRVERFCEVVDLLKSETVVFEESLQGFKVEAKRGPYSGAGELRKASGTREAFSEAFQEYDKPFEYLQRLLSINALNRSDLYKLFVKISYTILNEDGFEVSGGERSEYRLIQEISDSQNYDILLLDEPESSFDNVFLRARVNEIVKSISRTMPVVVVTHNNTVGASSGADFLLHTRKESEGGEVRFHLYSGYPTDKTLSTVDGRTVSTHDVLMESLEAGSAAYTSRKRTYEATRD